MSNIKWQSAKHYEAGDAEPTAELQPNLLTLYSMRYCPFAQRTRLVLQHKQIPHQIVNVNLAKKPDWFLARSATGKVPVLQEPDGWLQIESLITADYLEELHPDVAPLYPRDPRQRAKIRFAISKMGDAVIPAYYRWLGHRGDEQKADWETLVNGLALIQADLGDSLYFGGCDKAQMGDLMIWPWIERIPVSSKLFGFELPADKFERLLAWAERMSTERAVIETRTADGVHRQFYQSIVDKNVRYDGFTQ